VRNAGDESKQVKSILEQLDSSFQSKVKASLIDLNRFLKLSKRGRNCEPADKSPKVKVIPEKLSKLLKLLKV
jgi:hypothetical protein